MSHTNSNSSSSGSQSPSSEAATSPTLLTSPLTSRGSDETDSHSTRSRGTPNRIPIDLPRPASAGKGGCWTCRLRRKKCDEQREGDSCHTCNRLKIQCLGWGSKRPAWMRDKQAVEAYKADIKAQLTRAGLIRGQPRSSILQATSSSSSTVFTTQQYQASPGGSRLSQHINDPEPPLLTFVDTTQGQGSTLNSPFDISLSLYGDSPFPQLTTHSPYTTSASIPSSYPSPHDIGPFDHNFDSVTPQALGFNPEATALSGQTLQTEHVFYYFEHVRKLLFAFAGNAAANITYSLVLQDPQGPLTNAICALASLHNMRVRAARGLEQMNSTLENSPAMMFYDTAHAQLYKARQGVLTEADAGAALHLLGFSIDWMVQTGITTHENPKLVMMNMSPAARLTLKATMWLDVMSTITLRTTPKHLPFYRRLLTGCPDEVLLGIAEISTLACWKAQEMRKGSLSMRELIRRGNIVDRHLRCLCDPVNPRDLDQTQLHPDLPIGGDVEAKGIPGLPSVVDTRQLVAKIYQEAAILYLHTVLSDPNPGVPEIVQSVDMITHLIRQLPMSALDRTMVFPICLAGCLTDDPLRREVFKARLVGQQSHFGTVHQALTVMETVWQRRDTRRGSVDWRDLLHVQGRNLLLLV
ncbi:fungal-specific transcription factor domain-containing protein [Melanogaster broomeanus]|nr:fungal-specific transcription factor domain-containing protein [Melanogaster broomeanus]